MAAHKRITETDNNTTALAKKSYININRTIPEREEGEDNSLLHNFSPVQSNKINKNDFKSSLAPNVIDE